MSIPKTFSKTCRDAKRGGINLKCNFPGMNFEDLDMINSLLKRTLGWRNDFYLINFVSDKK